MHSNVVSTSVLKSAAQCLQLHALLGPQLQVLDVARSERQRQLLRQSTNWITPQVHLRWQTCCCGLSWGWRVEQQRAVQCSAVQYSVCRQHMYCIPACCAFPFGHPSASWTLIPAATAV